ncbi:hypothetical protein [Streptomyces sp. NPDC001380]|uniref:hypothetical protein n=1 Tax=Streptomyces sp. NPDC001380 TaxID=3364566 RepID=UPI0036BDA3A3
MVRPEPGHLGGHDPRPRHLGREVHIAPVYLAGARHDPDPALRPLLALDTVHHHDDIGNLHLPTRDQRLRVGFVP